MSTTVAFINQNGGAGKTTSALAVALAAAEAGRRVLAVDLDPQHVLTRQAGLVPVTSSIVDALSVDGVSLADVIVSAHGCDWLPGHPRLADVETTLARTDDALGVVADLLEQLAPEYELMVLDAPPNLGQLSLNALRAAGRVIVPVNAQNEASAEGLLGVIASMDAIDASAQLDLIITRYDERRVAAAEIAGALAGLELPDGRVLPAPLATIPERAAIHRAGISRQPLAVYAPRDPATTAYRELAQVLLHDAGGRSNG